MIFDAFERMVAFRYLRARRKEGFISVIAGFSLLGIGLGVATLIVVMAVMNGFRQELLTRILGINGHMGVYGNGAALTQFDPLAGAIRELPGVVRVIPTVEGQVMATSAGGASGAIVRGVRPDDLLARDIFAKGLGGSADAFKAGEGVLIGYRLAEKLGLQIGDTVTLISPKGNATAFGTVPRMRGYTVAGTFNVGMFEYDSGFMFMPLEAAQTYFKYPDSVTQIEVFLNNPDKVSEVRNAIYRLAQGNVRIYDWQQANANFFNAVQVERNVMFLILTLIILVAAFNIISSLIMLVKDKGRDIAILRTMGATRGMIMRIFFLAGASVGVVGTVLGTLLGVWFATHIEQIRQFIQSIIGRELFAAEIYFLTQLPARVETGEVVVVVLMALGLSIAATIYPSWRAANLDPVEALRYE
ncbi:lipoprotein-releasing ABC transporter permease subunit [Magnetospirillum sulfuroxidans]|uniref:Lipoprotein-releasing ABC transporter permease subunit n=1 Tax=Magnetospirillum sulfuroxidans TaxID=611300 RepID=A0ABS5IA13_9PROT|nr:lipoprotein-releasing ABC transporter permease subunit [Magnetospirillum sulfuroxidans]MBR9970533.1 lipoprotein-releasing ABC transporter permease subunit [Magnetospirillum sulfuroxidans]